jgi:UDP-N-acetylmuramoyl-L-alanyl-D-glutamate--2,6-diaminopimelate ligase
MRLEELLQGTGVDLSTGAGRLEITSIQEDSRRVEPGSLFVAVGGYETDGHLFAAQAAGKGAVAVLAERPVPGCQGTVLVNPSGHNRPLLAELAARFYHRPWNDLLTVGVTGTNGKTSTARMLKWILDSSGMRSGLMGTVGHVVGGVDEIAMVTTPGSLETSSMMRRMLDAGDRCCVMEVSSHALALSRVEAIRFDSVIFTNITHDHLDFHGTMGEYLRAKMHLLDLRKEGAPAVMGTYSPGWPEVPGAVTFGTDPGDAARIADIRVTPNGTSFSVTIAGEVVPVRMRAAGRFHAYNATGALASAAGLGLDVRAAADCLSGFPGVPGRFEIVDRGQPFLVAVDYAHTPDALERVLIQGTELKSGRLIVVFGAGGDRDSTKRPVMGRIAASLADVVIVTSDNPRTERPGAIIEEILAGIEPGRMDEERLVVEPDRRQAIRTAIGLAGPGDVVIIAGKGHEDYQIVGGTRHHFDDREEAAAVLKESKHR